MAPSKARKLPPMGPELAATLIGRFWSNPSNRHGDEAVRLVFSSLPLNGRLHEVLVKISVLNSFYRTNVLGPVPVARHIVALNPDARLAQGDLHLVSDIARVPSPSGRRFLLSFASKYCHWHRPDCYPMYDLRVAEALAAYGRQDNFASFAARDLRDYLRFVSVIHQFREHYGLTSFSLKQVDEALWTLGGDLRNR